MQLYKKQKIPVCRKKTPEAKTKEKVVKTICYSYN